MGQDTATNIDETVRNFVAPAAGTYYAQVSGQADVEYTLLVIRGADFDLEAKSRILLRSNLSSSGSVLGNVAGGGAGGVIDVAVVSSDWGSDSDTSLQAIVNQLNDNTYASFNATLVAQTEVDSLAELSAYDAVVIGGTL